LPKARSGEDVHRLSVTLGHLEEKTGIAPNTVRILALTTEIAISLLEMKTYIGSSSRLDGLTWGAEDLSADLGARETREADGRFTSPFRLARDLCLYTAVAAGVQPIDTVFANFRDTAGFERECHEAARDGFTAKMAIHPDQVEPINRAFTPSADEISRARTIVGLFAANPDAGVISHGGEMFDRPHLTRANRLLTRARQI
jgi:citrate lyase subunit beta/citryl-CoA lyase